MHITSKQIELESPVSQVWSGFEFATKPDQPEFLAQFVWQFYTYEPNFITVAYQVCKVLWNFMYQFCSIKTSKQIEQKSPG